MGISKRSPIVLLAAGGLLTGGGVEVADEKSPKSPKLLFGCRTGCGGGDVTLGGGAGFASKKLPPLSADLFAEDCRKWPAGAVKF